MSRRSALNSPAPRRGRVRAVCRAAAAVEGPRAALPGAQGRSRRRAERPAADGAARAIIDALSSIRHPCGRRTPNWRSWNSTSDRLLRGARPPPSYWLGLLSYDRGNFDVAPSTGSAISRSIRPVRATGRTAPATTWPAPTRRRESGRGREAARGRPADAPQRHGNLVRARRLTEAAAAKASAADK